MIEEFIKKHGGTFNRVRQDELACFYVNVLHSRLEFSNPTKDFEKNFYRNHYNIHKLLADIKEIKEQTNPILDFFNIPKKSLIVEFELYTSGGKLTPQITIHDERFIYSCSKPMAFLHKTYEPVMRDPIIKYNIDVVGSL